MVFSYRASGASTSTTNGIRRMRQTSWSRAALLGARELGLARAVLEEALHADLAVLGVERLDEQVLLDAPGHRPATCRGRGRRLLGSACARAARGAPRRPAPAPGRMSSSWGRPRRPGRCAAPRRPYLAAGDAQLLGPAGPTRRARRCVPPPPGMMPSRISGWPNTARSAGDAIVAREGQLAAASEGVPGDGSDDEARDRRHRVERVVDGDGDRPGLVGSRRTRRCRRRRRRSVRRR